jgi:hypothetical protein
MRRQVHLEGPLGVAEVELQGERGHDHERKRGQEGEAVGGLHLLDVEDPLQRREDERTCDDAGQERVQDDEDAPLELHLVRVHEPFDGVQIDSKASSSA